MSLTFSLLKNLSLILILTNGFPWRYLPEEEVVDNDALHNGMRSTIYRKVEQFL